MFKQTTFGTLYVPCIPYMQAIMKHFAYTFVTVDEHHVLNVVLREACCLLSCRRGYFCHRCCNALLGRKPTDSATLSCVARSLRVRVWRHCMSGCSQRHGIRRLSYTTHQHSAAFHTFKYVGNFRPVKFQGSVRLSGSGHLHLARTIMTPKSKSVVRQSSASGAL